MAYTSYLFINHARTYDLSYSLISWAFFTKGAVAIIVLIIINVVIINVHVVVVIIVVVVVVVVVFHHRKLEYLGM